MKACNAQATEKALKGDERKARAGAVMPRCLSFPSLLRSPPQISRSECARPSWQNNIATNCPQQVKPAPHSPWQNPFAERLIGSIRRECLNHVLVLGERHLRRILTRYFAYYHQARTHLALDKDAPDLRPIALPAAGKIVQRPEVGGLHHCYLRQAA